MELLAPAGSMEKLSYAYAYGADAAYIGIRSFSLRSRADNFHADEHAHIAAVKGDRKLYGALNIFFRNRDIDALEQSLEYISRYPLDACIISDVGILSLCAHHFPHTPLHLSTQANCLSSEAVKHYRDIGFSRIILGRELTLREIEQIRRDVPDIELEVFVHGAMCIAYSGRCLMSSVMAGRSANQGDCAHSCRWNYRVLEEEERPGEYYPVESGENYTALFSSRDLCMIDHLRDLRDAGVDSLKIEGRMKSLYYTAVVTRAYRKALDHMDEPELWKPYREDLFKVSSRELSTGFYYGRDQMDSPALGGYRREYLFLGTLGRETAPGEFSCNVRNQLKSGEPIEFITPDIPWVEDRNFLILDADRLPLDQADHGKPCTIIPSVSVGTGAIMRRKITPA